MSGVLDFSNIVMLFQNPLFLFVPAKLVNQRAHL
jgi:hypothetical protein